MGSLQFPNMGMGLRLAAFGRRSSANMGMGLRLAAFGRRSSATRLTQSTEYQEVEAKDL